MKCFARIGLITAVFGVVGIVAFVGTVQAQALAKRNSPRLMQGIRPLGMGGAFIAMDGQDENALFYNPAAINDFDDKMHFQFLLPTVEISAKAIPFFVTDLTGLASDIDDAATDSAKVNVLDAFAAANTGRYEEIGVHGAVANMQWKWVSASLFYDNRSVLALLNPASSTVDIDAVTDAGLQVGGAYGFFDGLLQAGGAIKFIGRHVISETITQRDVLANADFGDILDLKRFGFGVGVDLGVQGKIPFKNSKLWDYLDPNLALTLQDVADTRFSNNTGRIDESLSAGFLVHTDFWKLKNVFAFDVRDLEHQTDFPTKLRVGYEFMWPDVAKPIKSISTRVGLSQGYYVSGGLGMDFKYFKFNLATWGREISNSKVLKQSRMFGVQLASGF